MVIMRLIYFSFLLFLYTDTASAELPDYLSVYTTQGDLDTIFHAFNRLALICSDGRYQGLFISIVIISFLVMAFKTFGKGFIGKITEADMLHWFFTFLAGCIIYRAFIIPTTDVTIFDETANQTITVPGVPDAIALIANSMNMIEQGVIDIVDTSGGAAHGFTSNPGGLGFNFINKLFETDINLAKTGDGGLDNESNLDNYIKDCFVFEFTREGTTLTLDDIYVNTDFNALLAQAASPSNFTKKADGTVLSCSQAYADINTYLTALTDEHPAVLAHYERACSKAGWFDKILGVTGQSRILTCTNEARDFLNNSIILENLSTSQIFKQKLISESIFSYITSGDVDDSIRNIGNYNQGNMMISTGLMSAEWMPKIKSMMLAAFLGMSPFLLLFLASAMWRGVLSFLIGSFIFFTVWGICDAMMHQFALDKALGLVKEVADGKLGLRSCLFFASDSMKAYAVFGQYKIWSMTFAVLFSGALTKVGASQLGRVAIQQGGNISRPGNEAGDMLTDPGKKSKALDTMVSSVPAVAMANNNSFNAMQLAERFNRESRLQTASQKMAASGSPVSSYAPTVAAGIDSQNRVIGVKKQTADREGIETVSDAMNQPVEMTLLKNSITSTARTAQDSHEFIKQSGGDTQGAVDAAGTIKRIDNAKKISTANADKILSETAFGPGGIEKKASIEAHYQSGKDVMFAHGLGNETTAMMTGRAKGQKDTSDAMALREYMDTMGQDSAKIDSKSAMFRSSAKAVWTSIADNIGSDYAPLSERNSRFLEKVHKDPEALAAFRVVGAEGVKTTIDNKGKAFEIGRLKGLNKDESESLFGKATTLSMTMPGGGGFGISHIIALGGQRITQEDINQYRNDKGSVYSGIGQAIQNNEIEDHVDRLNIAKSKGPGALIAENMAQAKTITNDISAFYKQQGQLSGSRGTSLSLGLKKTLGISFSGQNTESEAYDLVYAATTQYLNKASEEGTPEAYQKHVGSFVNDMYNFATTRDGHDFGRDAGDGPDAYYDMSPEQAEELKSILGPNHPWSNGVLLKTEDK